MSKNNEYTMLHNLGHLEIEVNSISESYHSLFITRCHSEAVGMGSVLLWRGERHIRLDKDKDPLYKMYTTDGTESYVWIEPGELSPVIIDHGMVFVGESGDLDISWVPYDEFINGHMYDGIEGLDHE